MMIAVQTLHMLPQMAPTPATPTINPTLPSTSLCTATQQHQRQQMPPKMVLTKTPTLPTMPMADSTHPTSTPLAIVIDSLAITTSFVCHHQTLDHLKTSIQWLLSHTMAKVNSILDGINHFHQQRTNTRLIAIDATSTLTFPSPTPSHDHPPYPQQSPATISLNCIQIAQVPLKPLNLDTTCHPQLTTQPTIICMPNGVFHHAQLSLLHLSHANTC